MDPRVRSRRAVHEADSQTARRLADLIAEPTRRHRRGPWIARYVACDCIQRGRGIAHATHQRALFTQAMPELGMRGTERGPAARTLEPDQSAEGGRDANRSAGVVAVRD